jgi:hypothetical protein
MHKLVGEFNQANMGKKTMFIQKIIMEFNTIGLKINQMIHKNEKIKCNMCPNIKQFCIL